MSCMTAVYDFYLDLDYHKNLIQNFLVWLQTELDYMKFSYPLILTLTKFVII